MSIALFQKFIGCQQTNKLVNGDCVWRLFVVAVDLFNRTHMKWMLPAACEYSPGAAYASLLTK